MSEKDSQANSHSGAKPVLEPWTADWCGTWSPRVCVRNPFPFAVEVSFSVELAGGAFEVGELPEAVPLAVGELYEFDFAIAGGSRSPGADPKLLGWFRWRDQDGKAWGLQLDAAMRRRRKLLLGEETRRLSMLREQPGAPHASVVAKRKGRELLIRIEDSGGLVDPHLVARLGEEVAFGGESLRIRIPGELSSDRKLPFSIGFEGRQWLGLDAPASFRRWAGGVPSSAVASIFAGVPGTLQLI